MLRLFQCQKFHAAALLSLHHPFLFLPGLYVLEVLSASYTLFLYSLFFTFHRDA